jgi:hypothetical protein
MQTVLRSAEGHRRSGTVRSAPLVLAVLARLCFFCALLLFGLALVLEPHPRRLFFLREPAGGEVSAAELGLVLTDRFGRASNRRRSQSS